MSVWRDRECPTDPYDAFREGRRSESYDRNPYKHGRYDSYGRCRDAYDAWERGHRYAEYDRQEAAERRRAEEAEKERIYQDAMAAEQERLYYEAMAAEQLPQDEPPPSEHTGGAGES